MKTPGNRFWVGRRVLITGHTGFKGSWLGLWLAKLGANVTGLALPPATAPSAFRLMGVEDLVDSHFGDIRDEAALDRALRSARPQVVFHLAAQATVRRANIEPAETFDVNVMGTLRLLEAIRRYPSVRAVVVVTSDKCYAERKERVREPFVEADPLGGSEPYSASKACAEIVTAAYRQSFLADRDVRIATARAGNVIGGGDWTPDRLVTDLVRALGENRTIELRYPDAIRPWQHVLEPLAGYLLLAEALVGGRGEYAEAWNFGPAASDVTPVREFVERFAAAWGSRPATSLTAGVQPAEALHLLLDSSHARYELDWRCRLSLESAIAWTVDWYRTASDQRAAAAFTELQIEQYALAPELSVGESPIRASAASVVGL